ncbi:uncharacterized protein [Amphiura filiformis]|uniref:uncharacterized protein n=1 Tax=Amphiura filiformis TaxID=82378 RepID=UPI003B218714
MMSGTSSSTVMSTTTTCKEKNPRKSIPTLKKFNTKNAPHVTAETVTKYRVKKSMSSDSLGRTAWDKDSKDKKPLVSTISSHILPAPPASPELYKKTSLSEVKVENKEAIIVEELPLEEAQPCEQKDVQTDQKEEEVHHPNSPH